GRRAGVGGDLLAGVVGGLGGSLHLGVGGLRVADLLVLASDAAGDAELDVVGASLELGPGRGAETIGAIGLDAALRAGAVAAGDDDGLPRAGDPRAAQLAA